MYFFLSYSQHNTEICYFVEINFISVVLDSFPEGLSDVSFYPDLFAELARRDWTDEDLKKLAGLNLIRVFKTVEVVRITHY